jgi:hypothetical protein
VFNENVFFVILDMGLLAVIVSMHFAIGWRLRIVGEQG